MSDHLLKLIPDEPEWLPSTAQISAVCSALHELLPADEPDVRSSDEIEFHDATELFERVSCPYCHAELSMDWFFREIEQAWQNRFADLAVTVPCCSGMASLNDLDYHHAQGFARFSICYTNPSRYLDGHELALVDNALGHRLRKILVWL